jgi:outer membrane lipoprotein SlyB
MVDLNTLIDPGLGWTHTGAFGVSPLGHNTGVGTVGGAALGGIAGAQIGGSGAANAAGAIAGAIVGGLVGNAVENNANQRNGVEVTVRLDSGRTIAVPQENAGENFRPGYRVRLLSDGYSTRVAF